jgi:predicted DCC family thiol-disulfide oxidoreductase YuxK
MSAQSYAEVHRVSIHQKMEIRPAIDCPPCHLRRSLEEYHGDVTEADRNAMEGRALLLYDGVCALCNGVVKFLIDRDRLDRIRYAPLQSDLGREALARFGIREFPDGVMLLTGVLTPAEQLYERSDGFAVALQLLGGPWPMVGKALAMVPRWLREWGYGIVARFRYRVFGRYDACPIPPPEQRSRLLGVYE